MRIHDTILGLFFVGLGGLVLYIVSGYPKMPGQDVGPALFPGIAAALLAAFGAAIVVRSQTGAERGRPMVAFGSWVRSPRHVGAGLSVIVGCLVYTLAASRIGFLLIVPPLLLCWHLAFGARMRAAVVSAVVTTAIVWGFFYKGLGVPLPWGLLKNFAF